MNYFEILKKITSVSFFTSILAFSTSFLISIFSTKENFANYTVYISLIGLIINIMPFGLCMLLTVSRFNVKPAAYFNYMRTGFFVISPLLLFLSLAALPLFEYFSFFNIGKVELALIFFLCYFNTINLAAISYFRVSQLFKKYSIFFIFYTFNNTFVIFLGLLVSESFSGALYLSLFFSLLLAYFSVTKGVKLHRVSYKGLGFFSFSNAVYLIRYGSPIVLSTTTMSFLVVGDKLIFGNANEVDFPRYAIASLISSTSLFVINNFASSWGAYLSKNLAGMSLTQRKIFCESKLKMLLLIVPMTICALLIQFVLYKVIYESEFPGLYTTIAILSLSYAFFGASKFFMGFINFEKKNFSLFLSSLGGATVIVSLSLLCNDIQLNEMAFIFLAGMFSQFFFCLLITKNIYGVRECSIE